jgi:hypothetical protein
LSVVLQTLMLGPSPRLLQLLEAMTLLKSSLLVASGHLVRSLEMKVTPQSKILVPMPQVTPFIGAQELGLTFEVRIVTAACLLVGNYNIVEHNVCKGLRHGQLNRMFELAGMLYQPRPMPIVCK